MATILTTTYDSVSSTNALTITLASLATSSTLLAGRQSTIVDNTSTKYMDFLVSGQVTAGTTLTFDSSVVATSSEADADANTQMQAGSLVLSNATLTKVSAAMTAGKDSLTGSVPDFSTAFSPLTDTYNHHG